MNALDSHVDKDAPFIFYADMKIVDQLLPMYFAPEEYRDDD